ncbi:MAG: inorganic triphosphatase [Betaproteobacteria bacterium HGW-Betaproteobacteria-18]|nr:MAG: inorganic triphosphatase [Betaproteobacteria bacterium HGW-Betaproteobacteria-18]
MKSRPRNCAHQEVELKLCLPGADPAVLAKRLARTPALARRKPTQLALFNIYFDTPEQALRQRGVALRLRRVGSAADPQWLQTLKTSTGELSALSQRGEWECAVAGPALEMAALADTVWTGIDPDGRLFAVLAPCFVTRFQRSLWPVRRRDGSAVEVALDIGHIEAEGKQAPICELELELKAGQPAALFDLARQLAQGVAVLPANQSKAERGFLLAQDALDRPQRARTPELVLPLSRPELVQRVLREMFAHFTQNLDVLRTSDDPEVVHQARVGWRRLRSCLRLFRKTLAAAEAPSWLDLQPLLAGLGDLRNLDVAVTETLPALSNAYAVDNAARAQAWQAILGALAQAAARQRQAVRQTLQVPAVGLCLLALTEWLEQLSGLEHAGPVKKAALQRWARRRIACLQQRLALAQKNATTLAQQHRVRILAKRLRYGVQALRELLPKRLADTCSAQAIGLQNTLGFSRDVAQAAALVARHGLDPAIQVFLQGVVAGYTLSKAPAE